MLVFWIYTGCVWHDRLVQFYYNQNIWLETGNLQFHICLSNTLHSNWAIDSLDDTLRKNCYLIAPNRMGLWYSAFIMCHVLMAKWSLIIQCNLVLDVIKGDYSFRFCINYFIIHYMLIVQAAHSRWYSGPVRWLVLVLVWTGWCWFFVREKYCWLAETNKRTGWVPVNCQI